MFVFVFEEACVLVEARDSEDAVRKLADRLSQIPNAWPGRKASSDDPADYWADIEDGNIMIFEVTKRPGTIEIATLVE